MSTALETELLQAVEDGEILARMVATMGHAAEVVGVTARVQRLRQRAAWVRAILDEPVRYGDVLDRLTGPIPAAETDPPTKET